MAGDYTWAQHEFAGARLPDERFRRQLVGNAGRLAEHHGESFSAACGHAGRQAAKRLWGHHEVTMDDLLAGHYEATAGRCADYEWVLVATDTTALDFSGHASKAELGPVGSGAGSRGLLLHSALALSPERRALGLLGVQAWTRERSAGSVKGQRRAKVTSAKESGKWLTAAEQVAARLPASQRVLVVEDREADVFDHLAAPRRAGLELLVRACQDRLEADGEPGLLFAVAAAGPVVGEQVVEVPARPGQRGRAALLTVRARRVRLVPPERKLLHPEAAEYWLVRAAEEEPAAGEKPLEWVLLTTLDCAGEHDPRVMPEYYAARWEIERLHYTLKSGMGAERLQIADQHTLQNALAVLAVTAWRVLDLTALAREQPERAAAEVLSAEEVEVLSAAAGRAVETVGEAVLELAKLAGHQVYKTAAPPGLKRVWLGLRRLVDMVAGFRLARAALAGNGRYEAG